MGGVSKRLGLGSNRAFQSEGVQNFIKTDCMRKNKVFSYNKACTYVLVVVLKKKGIPKVCPL